MLLAQAQHATPQMIRILPWDFWDVLKVVTAMVVVLSLLWFADQVFSPISTLEYGIVGFFGKRGSGKSFTMVQYARRWRRYNPHKPVYTNLEKLDLPGDGPIYLNCEAEQIMEARDSLVAIDEAGIFLNAWNFTNTNQRKLARWIAATRHSKVMLLLTAHVPTHVNNRVRDVIDEFYMMSSWKGIYLFHGYVYESSTTLGKPKAHTKQVFIPMLPTTMKSYNTDSLRRKADAEGVNIIGKDESLQIVNSGSVSQSEAVKEAEANVPVEEELEFDSENPKPAKKSVPARRTPKRRQPRPVSAVLVATGDDDGKATRNGRVEVHNDSV